MAFMPEAQFMEKVPVDQAKTQIREGRLPYQWITADPHVLPIFGPAYDEHGSYNIAKREGRLASTVEEAQSAAKRVKTEIVAVYFLKS